MNVQERIERIEALEAEFNERLKALKAEVQQEQEFPQYGDTYWYIGKIGTGCWGVWEDSSVDKHLKSIGNVFETEGEAEFAVEKLKVEAELRKLSDVWNLEKTQYTFSFNWEDGRFNVEYPDYKQYANGYYFDNIIALQDAIETVGKDRIKKYLFGVED
ncbi:hypothetical protein ACFXEB_06795 [Aerococcus urinaeequi]|uniref:hypothetical protein n=1 Tax=Aerococcus urinaeequi TaxID=51665 RepID=UPI00366A7FA0